MKQLILFALTVASSLVYGLNSDKVLAQISLSCPTQGVLALIGKFDLNTTQQAQCDFTVDNTVSSIGVTINLGPPSLISGKPDPSGTNRTAQLTYPGKTINESSSTTDTFSGGTTTTMFLNMQIQRPNEFFAGSYIYGIIIDITSP